ncbi:MAG: Ig-like domain-containing protein [bacterium]
MRKITMLFLVAMFSFWAISVQSVPTQQEIDNAIQKGLAWLASQQNANGSFGNSCYLGSTTAAVLAFEDEGHFPGGNTQYSGVVEKGLDYIFTRAYVTDITVQPAGDPDSDGDGKGVYFSHDQLGYETGMSLLCIIASNSPDRIVQTGQCAGWTYREVAEDVVDFFAYAQHDSGYEAGGWRYSANGGSDNSAAQWPVLGMIAAHQWGIDPPEWVKTGLSGWIDRVQHPTNGGTGYRGYSDHRMSLTGSLLVQMYFVGDNKDTPRAQKSIGYIDNQSRWEEAPNSTWYGNKGHPYAMFAIFKGLSLMKVRSLSAVSDGDWWGDYAQWLVDNQQPDGHWDGYAEYYFVDCITTGWYVTILQSTIFPVEIAVDVPNCAFSNDGYDVNVEYSVQRFQVNGTVSLFKDAKPEPVQVVELEDFQGSDTFTYNVANDTPGEHTWRAVIDVTVPRELGQDVNVQASDTDSLIVYLSPVVEGIPDQTAPFETFDLDDYLTTDVQTVSWSFTNTNSDLTVNIGTNNIVTLSATPGKNVLAEVTFTATVTGCAGVTASDSDTAVFTSYPPIVDFSPIDNKVEFAEDGSAAIDLDDFVTDLNHTDAELEWEVTGNTHIHVEIDPVSHLAMFTADEDWSGSENLVFTVTDPRGLKSTDTLNVIVTAENDAPSISEMPDIEFPEDTSDSSLMLDEYVTDVDNTPDEMTWTFTGNTHIHIEINPISRIVTFTADENWFGSEEITFTVTDPDNLSDSDTIIVTVTPVNDPPIVEGIPDVTFPEDGSDNSIDLDDYIVDVDNTPDEMTWTFTGNTHIHVEIDLVSHVVTFTADKDWSGSEEITFTATDLGGLSDSDTILVTVTPVLDVLAAFYDVLYTTLSIVFDTPVDPVSVKTFNGISMELNDSGNADFSLIDKHLPSVINTDPSEQIDIWMRYAYPTTLNMALAALIDHHKVDLLLEPNLFTDINGTKNRKITGADNIRIQMITHGIVLGILGDVTGNGEVTAYDAVHILKASVDGLQVCPAYEVASKVSKWLSDQGHAFDVMKGMADVSGDGEVTAYDAALALRLAAKLPVLAPPISDIQRKSRLSVDNFDGNKFTVSIALDKVTDVYSADILLAYDPQKLASAEVIESSSLTGWFSAYKADSGKLRISLAGSSQPTADGAILNIFFDAKTMDAIKGLEILDLKLNGGMIKAKVENLPKQFAALQNYPNPFNPETWIPFQLSEPSEVSITIYNINGQAIRRLDLGNRLPGYYIDKSKAAYWDGNNEYGERVSSGVYFYELRAGKDVSVKKMIIIK